MPHTATPPEGRTAARWAAGRAAQPRQARPPPARPPAPAPPRPRTRTAPAAPAARPAGAGAPPGPQWWHTALRGLAGSSRARAVERAAGGGKRMGAVRAAWQAPALAVRHRGPPPSAAAGQGGRRCPQGAPPHPAGAPPRRRRHPGAAAALAPWRGASGIGGAEVGGAGATNSDGAACPGLSSPLPHCLPPDYAALAPAGHVQPACRAYGTRACQTRAGSQPLPRPPARPRALAGALQAAQIDASAGAGLPTMAPPPPPPPLDGLPGLGEPLPACEAAGCVYLDYNATTVRATRLGTAGGAVQRGRGCRAVCRPAQAPRLPPLPSSPDGPRRSQSSPRLPPP